MDGSADDACSARKGKYVYNEGSSRRPRARSMSRVDMRVDLVFFATSGRQSDIEKECLN